MDRVDPELRALAENAYGALNARDLDSFLALIADDVEFTSMVAEAEGTTFYGHDGVRAWWETVLGAFEDAQWELLEIDGSGDTGTTKIRIVATLAGVEMTQTMWQAARVRHGKLCWWGFFRSEREAREAAGF